MLRQRLDGHPHVGDIRGRGLFVGVEFVRDRKTKAPFGAKERIHPVLKREAMRLGLTITAIGAVSDCAMLTPPFIVSEEEVDRIAQLFVQALEAALAQAEAVA